MRSPIRSHALKGKSKMYLPHDSLPAIAKFTHRFQLRAPETSGRLVHRLRKEATICFRCRRRRSLWVCHCPVTSVKPKFPKIYCRCGHGFCKIRTFKTNMDPNYRRRYYTCPIKRGKKCKEFVKWCDYPVDESDLRPPLYKYPMCSCGAGVCRKVKETRGPNEGLYFFACPIGEGRGGCNFHLWEDTLLAMPNIFGLKLGNQSSDWFSQEADIVTDTDWSPQDEAEMVTEPDWLPQEEAEMVTGSDWLPHEAEMVTGAHDNTDYLSTPLNFFVDDLQGTPADMNISVSLESLLENARSLFHPSSSTTNILAHQDHINVNYVKPEEHIEEEKVRLGDMRDMHAMVEAEFEAAQQPPPQLLQEEALSLKLMLQTVEEQITCWELEAKEMKAHISEIKAKMMEAEESVKKLPADHEGESSKLCSDDSNED